MNQVYWVSLVASGLAMASAPAQAQQQQQQQREQAEICDPAPYAVATSEVAVRATAQFQLSLARVLQDQLQPADGATGSPARISLNARVAKAAAAGFAANALSDTLDVYYCRVLRATTDPARRQALTARQAELKEALRIAFNPALYGGSPAPTAEERSEDRQAATEELTAFRQQVAQLPALMETAAVSRELPHFNHSTVTIRELLVDANVVGVSADVCLGMVRKSLRVVDPAILVALDKARQNYIWWLDGSATLALQDFRLLASQVVQRSGTGVEAETQVVTPQFQTCLQQSAEAAAAVAGNGEPETAAEAGQTPPAAADPPSTETPAATQPQPQPQG
jgi:hypothetical protein